MENTESRGQCELVEKVINRGICVTCGACVNLCPYFDYYDGKVVVMDACRSDTWRCIQLCPRADYEKTSLDKGRGPGAQEAPIGLFKRVFIARAREPDIREKAQYGGVVSALLIFGIEKGLIGSAILTDRRSEISPGGMVARTKGDILHCAGSRYTAAGGLAALNRALKDGEEDLAVVGLPCQMEALARMVHMEPDGMTRDGCIRLKIGLFCTWALDYRKLNGFLQNLEHEASIKKYDIPPPPAQIFQVLTEKGWKAFPLQEVRPFIQRGCSLCEDMTAEMADISVGTVEGMEGWNTVVVRTDRGSELSRGAIEAGVLEIDDLPKENLEHLKEASLGKRRRGHSAKEDLRGEGSCK